MAIIEYEGGGWNRVSIPEGGSVTVYDDGLCNIADADGRVVNAPMASVRCLYLGTDAHPVHGAAMFDEALAAPPAH